jgi:uncharacterized protein YbjQ (UPF0145 family)
MHVNIDGELWTVDIPKEKRAGETFTFEVVENVDMTKIYTSTLQTVPGMLIAQSKSIVWGSVSFSFSTRSVDPMEAQQQMGEKVESLIQEAQAEIVCRAAKLGCNAVLGMTFNISNDSSGETGEYKLVIVTACGTPCIVVPVDTNGIVFADAVVEPLD